MPDQGPHGPDLPSPEERRPASVPHARFGGPRTGSGRQGDRHPDDRQHGGTNGRNGHPSPYPVGRPLAEVDEDDPIDLVELQADDELINAIASGLGVSGPGNRGYDVDDRLVALLSTWKDDVDRDPIPDLVDPDEAVAILQPAKPSRKVSFLRPLVAAAAVAACALAVVSIGAHEAQPGDALWGVSKVLYSDRAEQVQAATDLRTGIERVNAKLATGDTAGARADLAALAPLLDRTDPDRRDEFEQQERFLRAKVAETPPGTPTDPRAPLRDGTPAPPPPAKSEGSEEPAPPATRPRPQPGTSTPGGTTGGTTSPEGTRTNDPSVLSGPGGTSGPGTSSGSTPPTSSPNPRPEPSPTTEGSADPTTTSTTPTAAGEGSADPSSASSSSSPPPPSSASSTSTGAVSSTPN
ncbi:hypothetical protein H7X46_01730 [Pseudonocardia sp. C8]|uniref:anti-sigma-D factor RsdA n=1 Tax=Pseudonocardia sp. C8 TaxID=2762759 RepID=UPI0016431BA8|nr:anti-sigma-D factor RsdA [Pseudonocardia sp. C8]MBC3189785.1 hypothetical protein [Pseudonocardia sp. C8]